MESYKHIADAAIVQRLSDGAFIPFDPLNRDYRAYLADAEAGATVLPSDEAPDPVMTTAEQVDALVEQSKPALARATTLADIKLIFGGVLDGMKSIYGTSD